MTGPSRLFDKVKCFSITLAPSDIAPKTVACPGVWSLNPSMIFLNFFYSSIIHLN